MAVTFTRAAVSNVTHNQADLLIDYTGDATDYPSYGQPRTNQASLNFLTRSDSAYFQVWYFRPRGGDWQITLERSLDDLTLLTPTTSPRYRGIYEVATPTQANLQQTTDYEFWYGIVRALPDSGAAAQRVTGFLNTPEFAALFPSSPPTGEAALRRIRRLGISFGYTTVVNITGSFTCLLYTSPSPRDS